MSNFCTKCGNRLNEGANFCVRCGTPASAETGRSDEDRHVPDNNGEHNTTRNSAPAVHEEPKTFRYSAISSLGETAMGGLGPALSRSVPGAGSIIGSGIRSFFSSFRSLFKDPLNYIPVLILAGVWLITNVIQAFGFNPFPLKMSSFLIFADGGTHGGIPGAIGGIIGKGLFAGALASLIKKFTTAKTDKKRSFSEIVSGAFGITGETVWTYLTGAGAAMLVYLFISGGSTASAFMCGVAASYLAARSALSNGFLNRLISSLTSKGRPFAWPGVSGFVRGLAAGFAATALTGITGIGLILLIAGLLLFTGGAVMTILQLTGVISTGKGAQSL